MEKRIFAEYEVLEPTIINYKHSSGIADVKVINANKDNPITVRVGIELVPNYKWKPKNKYAEQALINLGTVLQNELDDLLKQYPLTNKHHYAQFEAIRVIQQNIGEFNGEEVVFDTGSTDLEVIEKPKKKEIEIMRAVDIEQEEANVGQVVSDDNPIPQAPPPPVFVEPISFSEIQAKSQPKRGKHP